MSDTQTILAPVDQAAGPDPQDSSRIILDCYLSSMQVLAECLDVACPAVGPLYYEQFARIRRRLAYDTTARTLTETRESLETTLAAYADQAHTFCELRQKDMDAMLETLQRMDEVAGEEEGLLTALIADLRKRILATRESPIIDNLTGLANRRELERQILLRLAAGRQFCVLIFDIDDFGRFNETLGRESGDQVLKQLAERLLPQIRARDVAARWLADEFIVVMETTIEHATNRLPQMARALRGPYKVQADGADATIEISLSAAVTEVLPDDTPRQIWQRLEENFHAQNAAAHTH